ncbi:hypothetical protein ACFE04_005924 [Oxalis oulophora]
MEGGLSEEEKKALRGSKFAPLPPPPSSRPHQPRLAHPGGPLTTNKGAALAKFLQRKLQDPNGLSSINPDLVERAVKNAKDSISAASSGGPSSSCRLIKHVTSFDDPEYCSEEENLKADKKRKNNEKNKSKKKKNKDKKKNNKLKVEDVGSTQLNKPKKKKLKLSSP